MKYEFASPTWFAALHGVISELARTAAAANPNLSFSICEVFTNVPQHLATLPGKRAAWHAVVRGADVQFGLFERDDVEFKAVIEYASVLPLAHYDTMGRPERIAELQSMSKAAIDSGRLQIRGESPAMSGGPFAALHDVISRLTK